MKALVALFALVAGLMVAAVFVTEKPAQVPEDAVNVRSGFLGSSYDRER